MKKILLTAAASAAFIAAPAFAQDATDSADFGVEATVQQECSIGDITAVAFGDIVIEEGAGANALKLGLASQTAATGGTQNVYVSCNYAADISATTLNNGLLNAAGSTLVATDPNDFTNLIEYRIELTSTDSSFPKLDFRTRLENSDSVNGGGAFHDNASLRIYTDRDDMKKRPVAGTYTDVATISLGAV